MKKLFFTTLLIFLFTVTWGEERSVERANYQLAARFSPKKVDKMVFSTMIKPNWFKDSDRFWYVWSSPAGRNYYIVDPQKGTKTELFDNAKLAAQLTEIVKDPFDSQNIPLLALRLKDDNTFTFQVNSSATVEKKDTVTGKNKKEKKIHYFEYDIASKELKELEDYEPAKRYPMWGSVSPNREYVLFSRNFNLWYMDMDNFEKLRKDPKDSTIVEHQLTTDGTAEFAYGGGNSDFYATEKEKSERKPAYIAWSPDSKKFVFIRSNYEKVKDLWVINALSEPRPKLERYKYHMAGEANAPSRHLYLFDMESKEAKEIETAAYKDQELSLYVKPQLKENQYDTIQHRVWQGDNESLYLLRSSRDLKRVDLCRVNLKEESIKTIIEERFNSYIETREPKFVDNNIVWWSERSGWAHLYLYDTDGNLVKQLTSGEYHVEEVVAIDKREKAIYFTANGREEGENPYYAHQYRVNFDGSNLKLLNSGNYNSVIFSSENGKYFINNYSRVDTTPKVALNDNGGRVVMELEEADLSLLFEAGYKFPETFTTKAGDGITDLHGVIYKPFDFDSTKLYPIIEYVYPGPQTEAVNYSWSGRMDRVDRLAQLGFIVVTVGNRGGSPQRSKWYHNYGYGNLRDYGLEDKKVVVERLAAKHSFIDINRVGIHGHSGGGFMSTAAMLVYPDFFKVAVSSAGNHENNIYNRWWSETHHGVLEEISEKGDTTFKYSIDKNSALAKNLKGHLLLVTGDIDNNVHPANTLRMVNALIRANKRFDMLMLPGQRHSFGDMTEYFFWRMADYFSEHLIGESEKEREISHLNND